MIPNRFLLIPSMITIYFYRRTVKSDLAQVSFFCKVWHLSQQDQAFKYLVYPTDFWSQFISSSHCCCLLQMSSIDAAIDRRILESRLAGRMAFQKLEGYLESFCRCEAPPSIASFILMHGDPWFLFASFRIMLVLYSLQGSEIKRGPIPQYAG